MPRSRRHRILCVAPSSHHVDELRSTLQSRYEVMVSSAPDHAVELFVSDAVATVVLASEFLTRRGSTLAQALKSLRPEIPVLLLADDPRRVKIPHVLDAVLDTPAAVLREVERRLNGEAQLRGSKDRDLKEGVPRVIGAP